MQSSPAPSSGKRTPHGPGSAICGLQGNEVFQQLHAQFLAFSGWNCVATRLPRLMAAAKRTP